MQIRRQKQSQAEHPTTSSSEKLHSYVHSHLFPIVLMVLHGSVEILELIYPPEVLKEVAIRNNSDNTSD